MSKTEVKEKEKEEKKIEAKVVFDDAKFAKSVFNAVFRLIDDVNVSFSDNGMEIVALDGSRSAFVDVLVPAERFTIYEISEPFIVGMNLLRLLDVLKLANSRASTVAFRVNNDGMDVEINDEAEIIQKIRFMDLGGGQKRLVFNWPAFYCEISFSLYQKLVKALNVIGASQAVFELNDDELLITSDGYNPLHYRIRKDSPSVFEWNTSEVAEAKSCYSVKFLSYFMVSGISDTLKMVLATDKPLKIEYGGSELEKGHVSFAAAPRLEY